MAKGMRVRNLKLRDITHAPNKALQSGASKAGAADAGR